MSAAIAESKHRYVALDSLRGVCACMVVLYHLPGPMKAVPFVENSYLFVDFFFVLSGFVIGTSYGRRLEEDYPIGRYMIQRFFRVYPLHLFMLTVYFAFEIVFVTGLLGSAGRVPFTGDYSVAGLVQCLLLVQPFVGIDSTPWNGPAWSIATEFWTYLLFALAMKVAPRRIVPICLAVIILAPVLLSIGSDRNMNVIHDWAMTRCLFGFAAGVLCWKLPTSVREVKISPALSQIIELITVGLCGAFISFAGTGTLSLAAPLVFLITVLVFSREQGFVSRHLKSPPMVALGKLSYSIYMVHLFLIWRLLNVATIGESLTGWEMVQTRDGATKLSGSALMSASLTVILLAGVLVAAWLTYRFIEQPGRAFGRRVAAMPLSSITVRRVRPG